MSNNMSNGLGGALPSASAVRAAVASAVRCGLSAPAAQVLVANLDETVLLGTLGADVDALDATEATLVSVVLDMSGSMARHRRSVIEAYNAMLDALRAASAAENILVSTWTFADAPRLLSGYQSVTSAPRLDKSTYDPNGLTALYDTLLGSMTGMVTYGQQLADNGVPSKRILFVLSDGHDTSSKASGLDVRTAAAALCAQEVYTLAYAAFGSGVAATLAGDVGFPSVISARANASEMRRIFRQVSAGVMRVSQAAGTAAGGFF